MRFLSMLSVLIISNTLIAANTSLHCEASYAVGLEHFMMEQTSEVIQILPGESKESSYHKITVSSDTKNLFGTATDLQDQTQSHFQIVSIPQFSIQLGGSSVEKYPANTPGATFAPKVYLFIKCSN